jgi:hypothetical protein
MKIRKFMKWLGIILAGVILLLGLIWLCLPKGTRETMEFDDPYRTEKDIAAKYGFNQS